ncbi:5'-methylthioadenosine/adenosylhomocysteine nucleosidase [Listeria sp. PSOL-1]|uniref:5'-methylthioadenosine/adenosylhomocysteine nucleosidase n=1 Tax=Listeria sp. PSOL-1 TaxID=1844999 RepID=UPI0013D4FB00|nr:5'-methylthioadenosine/adenosylhomocysteine nucleosidase [Listeria sp. PSOL-1]
MKRIGIIGAMKEEITFLKAEMEEVVESQIANVKFYDGKLCGKSVVLLESGIGKVNAAISTTLLMDHFSPEVIINTGSAGGVSKELNIGDVIISDKVVHGDVDATAFGYEYGQVPQMPASYLGDSGFAQKAKRMYEKYFAQTANVASYGLVVTTDSFIATEEERERIKSHFKEVKAVEMEAAAISQVAYQFGVPFVIIRAISDVADKEAAVSFDAFLKTAAKASSVCIMQLLANW